MCAARAFSLFTFFVALSTHIFTRARTEYSVLAESLAITLPYTIS